MLRAHTVTRQPQGGTDEICFTGTLPFGSCAFTLRPVMFGRNSYLPELRCVLRAEGEGTMLFVTARYCRLTRIFMSVWYGLLLLITVAAVFTAAAGEASWVMLAVPAFWVWGYGFPHVCFWRPENRAREDLCRILKGTIVLDSKLQ